jgi:iron complex transport system substrate-binding protein
MLGRFARYAMLLCCAGFAMQTARAAEMRDDRGVLVRLAAPAARIITLAPNLTEIAFAAGAGDRVVGVARFSDYPQAAKQRAQIGDAARVDVERILSLKPDLIFAWKSGNQAGDIARLEQLGLRVFVTEPQRLADVPRLLRTVGALSGMADAAERSAAAFEQESAALRSRYRKRSPMRVFYEIWHRPLLTVNGEHMISDVLALCGGVNVFADAPLLTPSVSLEAMLAARPDVIVGGSSAVDPREFVAQWRRYEMGGLKDLPVFYVPPDEIQRATPRIALGAKAICEALESVRNRGVR